MSKFLKGGNSKIELDIVTGDTKPVTPTASWAPYFADTWRTTGKTLPTLASVISNFKANSKFSYASDSAKGKFNSPGNLQIGIVSSVATGSKKLNAN